MDIRLITSHIATIYVNGKSAYDMYSRMIPPTPESQNIPVYIFVDDMEDFRQRINKLVETITNLLADEMSKILIHKYIIIVLDMSKGRQVSSMDADAFIKKYTK